MHSSVIQFVARVLQPEDVKGMFIIEAGALDVNGSVRKLLESAEPSKYIATDMREGNGVDVVCMAENLPAMFGCESADIVICLEMLEHAEDWKAALRGLLQVMCIGGSLVLTTRSPGFPVHSYPEDYWRFSVMSMVDIMGSAGLEPAAIEYDLYGPGVFVKAVKPEGWIWSGIPWEWHATEIETPPGKHGPEWQKAHEHCSMDNMLKVMTGSFRQ